VTILGRDVHLVERVPTLVALFVVTGRSASVVEEGLMGDSWRLAALLERALLVECLDRSVATHLFNSINSG
jgi:hypothetical protein